MNVGGHPMESVSHGLRKEKRWEGVPKQKSTNVPNFERTQNRSHLFIMEDSKTPLLVVDKNNHLSKPNFYLSVLQMKSSSTCLITASLREGPFIYFYVESPPSTFMHRLREHSCHSEYNVHCPKVLID
jgi:hypothetical protein